MMIPIEFDMQWDDEHIPREADSAVLFFARPFGQAVTSLA